MPKKLNIEMDESYGEKLDVLRKVFVGPEGKELTNNGELLQGLTDTFMEFLQNQSASHEESNDTGCCGSNDTSAGESCCGTNK